MKKFYVRYMSCDEKLLRTVAVLPWSQNLLILSKDLDDEQTIYYATESISKGWNRDLLLNAIKMNTYLTAKPVLLDNNFSSTLPAVQAQYANAVFRDGYNLGFLGVTQPILELELERRLVEKIKRFLLELGKGFTFIGNQYELDFNGRTSKVDLLFFHRGLRCLVAIDLKIGKFIPEYAGKMNYYLSLLDRLLEETSKPSQKGNKGKFLIGIAAVLAIVLIVSVSPSFLLLGTKNPSFPYSVHV